MQIKLSARKKSSQAVYSTADNVHLKMFCMAVEGFQLGDADFSSLHNRDC